MRKMLATAVMLGLLTFVSVAEAAPADTMAATAARYGDYRLVVDTDNQLWTKADWENGGYKKARAASYVYIFGRQGVRVQMEAQFDGTGPEALVRAQRFTPDVAIRIKDFQSYFPELYSLVTSPKAVAFTTYGELTNNFREDKSPVTLGVLVKEPPSPQKKSYYILLAFNIQDEGRLVKNPRYIDGNTYIREFTIERVLRSDAEAELGYDGDWTPVKNYF